MKVAVVGCSGMVGRVMIELLEQRNFPLTDLIPVASAQSVGQTIHFKDKDYTIVSIEDAIASRPDLAIFSAGGNVSLAYAPRFAAVGTTVVDNSSAWRMDPDKKLIVPEINAHILTKADKIIANPNCSTIQMVVVLHPLHKKYTIKRLVISTYQAVTGTGKAAVNQLLEEREHNEVKKVYPYQIDMNVLPQCDVFLNNGYTKEEMKLVNETRKILGDQSIGITATAVRVPVIGGHSESVNVSFKNEIDLDDIRRELQDAPGVKVLDQPDKSVYPMPFFAHGKDEVFVGRIRRDESMDYSLNMWIVADNLRKGAATNAIQIGEYLVEKGLVGS